MATVWLVNKGGHDYSTLKPFGAVIPLTEGSVNPFNPDRLWLSIANKLAMSEPDDWLALSGSPLANGIAFAIWFRRFDYSNILQWSVGKGRYIPCRLQPPKINKET